MCCHSRILVLQPKLSVTYKRASRLPQQPSPAARWPSPFSPCYSNNSSCFSSSPLSHVHIELGLKKLCFFSFFAASTEFVRNGSCLRSQKGQLVPPQQLSGCFTSASKLTLNKAASCNTCRRSFQSGSGVTPTYATSTLYKSFFQPLPSFPWWLLRGTRCPRTTPFRSTRVFIPKPHNFIFRSL